MCGSECVPFKGMQLQKKSCSAESAGMKFDAGMFRCTCARGHRNFTFNLIRAKNIALPLNRIE